MNAQRSAVLPLIQSGVQTITPVTAQSWLDLNHSNRPLSHRTVALYADAMRKGEWMLNGEAIIFDNAGALINGQHRLSACVQSGHGFQSMVVYGVDPRVFDTLDQHRVRTANQLLGRDGIKNYNTVAAATRLIYYYRYRMIMGVRGGTIPNYEIIRMAKHDYPGIVASAERVSGKLGNLMSPRIAAFTHYLFVRNQPELTELFFEQLETGEALVADDPTYRLREALVKNAASRRKLPFNIVMAYTIKAWLAFLDGRKLKFMRFGDDEEFPYIYDMEPEIRVEPAA